MNSNRLRLFLIAGFCLCAAPVFAQFEVTLDMDGDSYMKYEPIVAHVQISNFTGHSIGLFNQEGKPWLTFYIAKQNGEEVSVLGKEYDLQQTQIAGGDHLTVNVDLTPVYNIRDSGLYHVVAIVYSASYNRQFKSNVKQFDLTPGRVLWQETVAVFPTNRPAASAVVSTNLTSAANVAPANLTNEDLRTYSLVASHVDRGYLLYARVENEQKNLIYSTVPLGVLVGFGNPEAMIDKQSHLHVLHQIGSRVFAYADVAPDGRVVMRKTYSNMRSRPQLTTENDGTVLVVGGEQTYPNPNAFPFGGTESADADTPPPKN